MADLVSPFNAADKATPGHYGPGETALLLLDFHAQFVDKRGGPGAAAAAQTAIQLRRWALNRGITVVHGLIDVRADPYETCKGRAAFAGQLKTLTPDEAAEPPELQQAAGTGDAGTGSEHTFYRTPGYVSALKSPGLEDFLRSRGIKSLLLTGLSTSGCVLRTCCAVTDAEYVATVISDACADAKEGVHDLLVNALLPSRAYVLTSAQFQEGFEKVHKLASSA